MIQTVCGPIEESRLGYTLAHEHIAMIDPAMRFAFPDWLDTKKLHDTTLPQLTRLKEVGIRTIIDATPINLGRDIRWIAQCANESGLQIVASTGLYYTELPWVDRPDPRWLAERYLREINEGIQGTDIRAGVIKCAVPAAGITPGIHNILQATAIAHRRSGLPVIVHTENQTGPQVQKTLCEMGVPAAFIVIAHSGDSTDLSYLEGLLQGGSYLGMDRFGIFTSTEDRIRTIVELVRRGWAHRMVLSHDSNFYEDPWRAWQNDPYVPRNPDRNMCLIPTVVLPQLKARGVSQADIDRLMCENVKNWFLGR